MIPLIPLMFVVLGAQAAAGPAEPPDTAAGHLPPSCPEPTHLDDFSAAARAGERAFAAMDLLALGHAREEALQTLPCLVDQVTPLVAADFHRMMAMAAFTSGDEKRVLEEFHAARRLEPGYLVPEEVAPAGHPLADLYMKAEKNVLIDRKLDPVIPPVGGFVLVDGVDTSWRLEGLSALLQAHDARGALVQTRYVLSTDPTPAWGPLPLEVEARRRRRIALGASAGAAVLLAGGLYTGAVVQEQRFQSSVVPDQDGELRSMQTKANSMLWASVGAGGLGVALATVTVVLW
jgi:hypothetical protein